MSNTKRKLKDHEIKALLISENPGVFDRTNPHVAQVHRVFITGYNKKTGEKKSEPRFVQTSNPTDEAQAVDITSSRYIRAMVEVALNDVTGDTGLKAGRHSKKPVTANIFESAQPSTFKDFFALLQEKNDAGEYTGIGKIIKTKDGLPTAECTRGIYGKIFKFNVHEHFLVNTAKGSDERTFLESGTYNIDTNEWVKEKARDTVLTMFVEDDDTGFGDLLAQAVKLYKRKVMPYFTNMAVVENALKASDTVKGDDEDKSASPKAKEEKVDTDNLVTDKEEDNINDDAETDNP
ncbi:MAG: hypothetical protein ACTSQF_01970 [Candidatus Heimdallarchaeaceae archaeon]